MWKQIFSSLVIFAGLVSALVPNEPVCGVKGPHSSDGLGIVGGDDAAPFEFPWQAALRFPNLLCGASILNNRWAITAARCLCKRHSTELADVTKYEFIAGSLKFRGQTDEPRTVVHIEKAFFHPKFAIDGDSYLNNIALLKLKESLPLSEPSKHLAPICLPKKQSEDDLDSLAGTVCTTTGWGSNSIGGPKSEILQRVNVTIQKQASCVDAYADFDVKVDTDVICSADPGKGTCDNDIGGPLICYSDNKWNLVGLTSWGFGCEKNPSVYTRVTKFLPWIKETIANNTNMVD